MLTEGGEVASWVPPTAGAVPPTAGAGAEACGPKLVLHLAQADRRVHLHVLRVAYAIEVPCLWVANG